MRSKRRNDVPLLRDCTKQSPSVILLFLVSIFSSGSVSSFSTIITRRRAIQRSSCLQQNSSNKDNEDEESKKQLIASLNKELSEYLEKRRTNPIVDKETASTKKTVGGTRGNAVLDFISVSPAPEREYETKADVFDYDELAKYGYGNLATAIMEAGGRLQFYEYFGLDTPVAAPVKDTYVADDTSSILLEPPKYTGLQLGLLRDDQAQAEALERARSGKGKEEPLTSKTLLTQRGKKSGGSVPKGDWTVERIDAWAKQQKDLQKWAREERERKIQADALENFDSLGLGKLTSIVTAFTTAFAFGRATPTMWVTILHHDMDELIFLKVVAASLLLASAGSSAYCGYLAPQLQRSRSLWMIKGLLGGPVAIQQLRSADRLQTAGEIAQEAAEEMAKE